MINAGAKSPRTPGRLALPARVRWRADGGEERAEATELTNFSPAGATLTLGAQPELGQLLCVTLTGPRPSALDEQSDDLRSLWGLVWATARQGEDETAGGDGVAGQHQVSVIFVGDIPVSADDDAAAQFAYLAEDDGRFRIQRLSEHVGESSRRVYRRKESRLSVPVELTIEVLGENGSVVRREQTVTENISRGGAAVWTSLDASPGQFVRLESQRHGVCATAVVRARRAGADGITRLHLEFLDCQWPLEKIV